jgi:hypothetical protein
MRYRFAPVNIFPNFLKKGRRTSVDVLQYIYMSVSIRSAANLALLLPIPKVSKIREETGKEEVILAVATIIDGWGDLCD